MMDRRDLRVLPLTDSMLIRLRALYDVSFGAAIVERARGIEPAVASLENWCLDHSARPAKWDVGEPECEAAYCGTGAGI